MDLKQWVKTWEQAGRELQDQRRRDLRRVNTAEAIESLSQSFQWAVRTLPPRRGSGLVEQQSIFSRLRETR
jgi:hypothetical protein